MMITSQNDASQRKLEPVPSAGTTRPTTVTFYEFAAEPDAQSIGDLAEAHLAVGRRVLIIGGSEERCRLLSKRLWAYRVDSFLPHGLPSNEGHGSAPDQNAARQPVLIDWDATRNLNGADTAITLCGRLPIHPTLKRIDYLFDGQTQDRTASGLARESEAVRQARQTWRDCLKTGHEIRYFSQLGRAPGSSAGAWSRSS